MERARHAIAPSSVHGGCVVRCGVRRPRPCVRAASIDCMDGWRDGMHDVWIHVNGTCITQTRNLGTSCVAYVKRQGRCVDYRVSPDAHA